MTNAEGNATVKMNGKSETRVVSVHVFVTEEYVSISRMVLNRGLHPSSYNLVLNLLVMQSFADKGKESMHVMPVGSWKSSELLCYGIAEDVIHVFPIASKWFHV